MLVSSIRGACGPIQHTGLCLAFDDAYSLWKSCNFELVFVHLCGSLPLPFLPSWLAMVYRLVSISTELISVTVPGRGCHSLGCRGYLRALLDARISLGTTTRLHRHLPQAHLLAMSLISDVHSYRPFQLVHFVFPFQTTWCPHGNFPFVFSLVMRKFARA